MSDAFIQVLCIRFLKLPPWAKLSLTNNPVLLLACLYPKPVLTLARRRATYKAEEAITKLESGKKMQARRTQGLRTETRARVSTDAGWSAFPSTLV
eukprot:6177129-Pleurochrysis_carterae.AAC.1